MHRIIVMACNRWGLGLRDDKSFLWSIFTAYRVSLSSGILTPVASMTFLGAMLCRERPRTLRHRIHEAWTIVWGIQP